jgi:DNA-binding CsgD family transcriptional regulator
MTGPKSTAGPGVITAQDREIAALELRRAGKTYRAIGAALGITEPGAHACVKRALARGAAELREAAAEAIELDLERLDALLAGFWDRAEAGDEDAADRVLKILERRAKLLGLDAAARTELTGADGGPIAVSADADARLLERLTRLAAGPSGSDGGGEPGGTPPA